MRKFQITLYVLVVIVVLTGLQDVFLGLRSIEPFSEGLSDTFLNDELYNAQYRFLGGIWLGLGALLYLAAKDLKKYSTMLKIVIWSIFVGGIGRLITILHLGLPENSAGAAFVLINMTIETVGMLALLWWHSRLMSAKSEK